MRIVVCVKQSYDPATVKISRSREEFDLRQAVKRMNRPDRYALEAALRAVEVAGGQAAGATVIALSAGAAEAEDVVREAVAMGADHGVLLAGPEMEAARGAGLARGLAAALERLGPVDLVMTGRIGEVGGTGGLPGRLAALLNCSLVLDAICVEPAPDGGLQAVVAAGGAAHAVPLPTPAVVAIAPGPDRPRYPTAARIANAYGPGLVDVWSAADLGLDAQALAADSEAGGLVLGPERTPGQVVGGSVEEAAGTVVEFLRAKRLI